MVKYTENVAHAHAVDTRPSFSLSPPPTPQSEGLGTRLGQNMHDVLKKDLEFCGYMDIVHAFMVKVVKHTYVSSVLLYKNLHT